MALPFIHSRPGYFAQVISELLFWVGPDKILLRQRLRHLDAEVADRQVHGVRASRRHQEGDRRRSDLETKEKILGLNAARLYDIDVEAEARPSSRSRRSPSRPSEQRGDELWPREAEVWARLERVDDPELDEPITAMGFVEGVTISGAGAVEVGFRLPTYWCSPNFAFLMAEDIRREVAALPWVARVSVRLQDHMWAERSPRASTEGRQLRRRVRRAGRWRGSGRAAREVRAKAFKRRQEAVILGLRELGWSDAAIVAMDWPASTRSRSPAGEAAKQKPRYRELLLRRGLAAQPGDLAFRSLRKASR